MQNVRNRLRIGLTWALILLIAPVIVSVLAEFFIELARERGLYDRPSETISNIMTALETVTGSWWFIAPGLLIVGAAGGLWLDFLVRKLPFRGSEGQVATAVQVRTSDNSQGLDLIPDGIRLEGERHRDGVDLTPIITIRNRGLLPLKARLKTWDCEIAGARSEFKADISYSGTMQPSTGRNIRLGKIRLYEPTNAMKGLMKATFIFRSGPNQTKYAMTARYEFAVNDILKKEGKFEITDLRAKVETPFYKAVSDK